MAYHGLEFWLAVLWNGGVRACDRQPDPRLRGETKGWAALLLASMSCGAASILSAYRMVGRWALHGDMAAIQDVVPTMAGIYTAALVIGIVLNLLVLAALRRRKAE